MARPKLTAMPREVHGKATRHMRAAGTLPAVIYGAARPSESIQIDAREFDLLRRSAGRNVLIDLSLNGGRAEPVLLHQVQEHPVTRHPLHVDFLAVNMSEERTVDVPIHAIGHSEAVDKLGGVLLHLRDHVQVRALPDDLPSALELDISPLVTFDDVLHASDLRVPTGVTLMTDGAESIARVQPPRVEEVEEVPAEEAAEEGAEGAEPTEAAAAGEPAEGDEGDQD